VTESPGGSPRFEELREEYEWKGFHPRHAAEIALRTRMMETRDLERAATCPRCGSKVYDEERRKARRADARYCSSACRQAAYRERRAAIEANHPSDGEWKSLA
jgi:hypothetical protein